MKLYKIETVKGNTMQHHSFYVTCETLTDLVDYLMKLAKEGFTWEKIHNVGVEVMRNGVFANNIPGCFKVGE